MIRQNILEKTKRLLKVISLLFFILLLHIITYAYYLDENGMIVLEKGETVSEALKKYETDKKSIAHQEKQIFLRDGMEIIKAITRRVIALIRSLYI